MTQCDCGNIPKNKTSKCGSGHYKRTKKHKDALSKRVKENQYMKNPITKAKHKKAVSMQKNKDRTSEQLKTRWQDPIESNKMLSKIQSSENRQKRSEESELRYKDPIYKKKWEDATLPVITSKEFKENIRIRCSNPEYKKRASEIKLKQYKEHPELFHYVYKNTKPELKTQEYLKSKNIEFKTNIKGLIGYPDIKINNINVLIFVDGDYWHCCEQCGFKDYQKNKTETVRQYDNRITKTLEEQGYKVIRIWEHEIDNKDFSKLDGIVNGYVA
jgi:DNA mismatch endonuclease (patch repair protein)